MKVKMQLITQKTKKTSLLFCPVPGEFEERAQPAYTVAIVACCRENSTKKKSVCNGDVQATGEKKLNRAMFQ